LEFNVPFQHKYGHIRDEPTERFLVPISRLCYTTSHSQFTYWEYRSKQTISILFTGTVSGFCRYFRDLWPVLCTLTFIIAALPTCLGY